jgi:RNA polymerase sigma-70 factor (ECF subfamily)
MENNGTLTIRRGSLVADDRTFYDERIAPLKAMMMRSIWRVVRNTDVAEDCLQDALTVVWKKRFRIQRHPNPQALILKICLNAACDSLRRLERLKRQTDFSQLPDTPAVPGNNANSDLEELEILEHVQRAIRRLPRKRALAVMMRFIHEESFKTIAEALCCSETTARIHVSRGRAQLRKWLSHLYQNKRQEAGNE